MQVYERKLWTCIHLWEEKELGAANLRGMQGRWAHSDQPILPRIGAGGRPTASAL